MMMSHLTVLMEIQNQLLEVTSVAALQWELVVEVFDLLVVLEV
jgi:hypothetical protein